MFLGDRTIALGRELTKIHEELVIRPISGHLGAIDREKGEYTLVVSPPVADYELRQDQPGSKPSLPNLSINRKRGVAHRAAIKQLARKFGRGARDVYALIEAHRDSGE